MRPSAWKRLGRSWCLTMKYSPALFSMRRLTGDFSSYDISSASLTKIRALTRNSHVISTMAICAASEYSASITLTSNFIDGLHEMDRTLERIEESECFIKRTVYTTDSIQR